MEHSEQSLVLGQFWLRLAIQQKRIDELESAHAAAETRAANAEQRLGELKSLADTRTQPKEEESTVPEATSTKHRLTPQDVLSTIDEWAKSGMIPAIGTPHGVSEPHQVPSPPAVEVKPDERSRKVDTGLVDIFYSFDEPLHIQPVNPESSESEAVPRSIIPVQIQSFNRVNPKLGFDPAKESIGELSSRQIVDEREMLPITREEISSTQTPNPDPVNRGPQENPNDSTVTNQGNPIAEVLQRIELPLNYSSNKDTDNAEEIDRTNPLLEQVFFASSPPPTENGVTNPSQVDPPDETSEILRTNPLLEQALGRRL